MKRLKIAIVFGGCSEEHDVSVKSATEIARSIDTEKYDPIYVGITRSGVWKLCERPSADWEAGDSRRGVISPDRETHGLLVTDESTDTDPCTSTWCSRCCTARRVRTGRCRACWSCPASRTWVAASRPR